jgi:hypothetical protein
VNAFIPYVTLEQHISAVFERVRSLHAKHNVTHYTSSGGEETVSPWKALGFYARVSPEARLVCETFHDEQRSIAVVRVFREGVVEPLYARKWAGDDSRFLGVVSDAGNVFAGSLPATDEPVQPTEGDMSWLPVSEEQRAIIQRALLPIPPPIRLAATPDA